MLFSWSGSDSEPNGHHQFTANGKRTVNQDARIRLKMTNETANKIKVERRNLKIQNIINGNRSHALNRYSLIDNNNASSMSTLARKENECPSKKNGIFDNTNKTERKFPSNGSVHSNDTKKILRKLTVGKSFR